MCNKKSPPPPPPGHGDHEHRTSMINTAVKHEDIDEDEEEEPTLQSIRIAARKSRTKTRKPKFLSLRSKFIDENSTMMTAAKPNSHRHQLNLFPLYPENLVGDDQQDRGGDMPDENVALFFHSDGGATLNGLLTSATTTSTATTSTTMSSDLEEECLPPYAYYRPSISAQDRYRESGGDIVRTAMRSREREASVEKWVSYSELVDRKEEACSTVGDRNVIKNQRWNCSGVSKAVKGEGLALALKLDYQEIMDAWSDKGPLYIDGGDSPQTVPDLLRQHNQDNQSFQLHDNAFTVPEDDGSLKIKLEQREASVLRYKEKRQSRLFSKRIRYQVRKLNAEKRPRMKGRFVKRSGSKSNSIEE